MHHHERGGRDGRGGGGADPVGEAAGEAHGREAHRAPGDEEQPQALARVAEVELEVARQVRDERELRRHEGAHGEEHEPRGGAPEHLARLRGGRGAPS